MECNEDEASKPAQKGTQPPELLGKVGVRKVDLTSAGRSTNDEVVTV